MMRKRWLLFLVLSALALGSVGATQHSGGTIRGYVYRDSNQNGVLDEGEEGIAGVFVTVSLGDYQHTYYTGAGDAADSGGGPGSYGPTALQSGYWKVAVHVPDGYRATTRTELYAAVSDVGVVEGMDFGLYGTGPITYATGTGVGMDESEGVLPMTGGVLGVSLGQWIALLGALVGVLVLIGTPWCVIRAKRAPKRWW